MLTALIEAPRPNTCFAKYDKQHILPNILLDIAGACNSIGDKVIFQNHIASREILTLPEADRYIVCISEVVEKCKTDAHLIRFIQTLRDKTRDLLDPKPVYLVGWYAWLNVKDLSKDFVILDPMQYESVFSANLPDSFTPDWDLIDWDKEPRIAGKLRATLRTSRGCGNKCEMCPVNIVYKRDRYEFPLDWVKKQITTLYSKGVRQINFLDDNLLINVPRAKELLQYLIDNKKTFKGMTYLFHEGMEVRSAQDKQLVKMVIDAGFKDIKLGVESLNAKTLEFIKKPYKDPALAIKAIENFNEFGVKPTCLIVFGFPTDTEQDLIDMTNTFAKLKVKIRAQSLYNYPSLNMSSPVSKERLSELMNNLLEVTGSAIWRRDKEKA